MRKPTLLAVAGIASAMAAPGHTQSVTVDQLQQALRQRDQEIAALEKRIAALEGRQTTAITEASPTAPSGAGESASLVASRADSHDDDGALQALSRGLIERGVLLLPRGSIELSPGISYSHSQKQGLVLVDTPQGISTVSDQRLRDDGLEFVAAGRLGLPWHSQLQLRVPFDWKREASSLGDGTEISHHAADIGDVELELSHQLLTEKRARPALIGAVSWRFPTGRDPFRDQVTSIASGNGTHQVTARVTALKTIDPLVVFTTLAYSANLNRKESFGRVHSGDTINWQLGALLALSPDSSLNLGFAQQFKRRTSVDDVAIKGSDGVAAVVQVGLDQVLSAHTLLDVSLGLGVTRDAPDYQMLISMPFRF